MRGAVRTSEPPSKLVDPYGRPITDYGDVYSLPRDPLSRLSGGDVKRNAYTVFRDVPVQTLTTWDVSTIRQALDEHRLGKFQLPAQLVDSLTGDDRVQSAMGSRTDALFGKPLVHTAKRDKTSTQRKQHAAWVKAWKSCGSKAVLEEMQRWTLTMGWSLAEILWDTSVTPWQPYLKPWHPQYVYYEPYLRKYRVSTIDGVIDVTPGDGKWFLHAPHGAYRGWMQGAVRALAQPWFIRQLAWRDWARYSERHGLPMLKAMVPAVASPEMKKEFTDAMNGLGQETTVMLPQMIDGTGFDVDILEATDRSWESFPGLMDRCDMAITLTILWQNLTTEVKEGSLAAARQHGDVRQNAIEFDNEGLSESVYTQLARPFFMYNYGDPEGASRSAWDVTPIEDRKDKALVFQAFASAVASLRAAGYELDTLGLARLALKYGIRLKAGEITIKPPAAGAPKANVGEPGAPKEEGAPP